ncbi:tyrosine-type recombinase/integrase [Streptomyces pinistramenti]|uniref:tyrosine-type recombinase/integrase n=1 Tax=Streptomyces pinistramenti TaxID=2884812 RepID=UPI001D090D9B|nr:tyrosine-type recombinase/integrase [Streptomyces pinistramenti]MCB5911071.1 tyrosine-type recombinase/integrase [Streptomyces pinistramenti]
MDKSSLDVRFYAIETNKRAKGNSYTVRWKVAHKKHSKTYKKSAVADDERSKLMTAHRNREPFIIETGLPVSWSSKAAEVNWYDFAVEYVDWKWPSASANTRKCMAKALTPATIALLRQPPPSHFNPVEVRRALREYAFNSRSRTDPDKPVPAEVQKILDWVQRNSLPMSSWEKTETVERVVAALGTRLDGTAAAASSVTRNERITNLAMGYALRHGYLKINPLPKGKGARAALKTAPAVDKRCLLNRDLVAKMLDWIGKRPRRGRIYRAFFATLYCAGLRPEEAVALRVGDATLPESGWGEFLVHEAQPEVGSQWTDTGHVHEERGLKGRGEGDTRPVPIHPSLVALLRELIKECNLKPTDYLFPGEKGGMLAGSVFRRVWRKARKAILSEHEFKSPTGRRVYDLRHTCLTTWLNSGIPPAQAAEWAGSSVPVLLATYARCVVGQLGDYLKRIEGVQDLPKVAT